MFSGLLTRLQAEIRAMELVIDAHERVRQLAFSDNPTSDGARVVPSTECALVLREYLAPLPGRLDWQIYDHSAAISRLYAAYEGYVNQLVAAYVNMLPDLYRNASDLPENIAVNHRVGIGQILIKIGVNKQYREVEEATAIRALTAGLGSGTRYSLVPEAFLVDRLNYRMDVLAKIFGSLDFENAGSQISSNVALQEFLRTTRGEANTAQGELESFVRYRNEASHGTPDQILAPEEIKKIGHFIHALAISLAEMVSDKVAKRHLEVGNSEAIGKISEVHHKGFVVIVQVKDASLRVGDELYIYDSQVCRRVMVQSLQIENADVEAIERGTTVEVGIRLSNRARHGAELRRLVLPAQEATTQRAPGERSELPVEEES